MMKKTRAASWLKFFRSAGIPSPSAETYAVSFERNQITLDMLPDIRKEYLIDMGIQLMGHIIAILKHAQAVHNDTITKTTILSTTRKRNISDVNGSKPTPPPPKTAKSETLKVTVTNDEPEPAPAKVVTKRPEANKKEDVNSRPAVAVKAVPTPKKHVPSTPIESISRKTLRARRSGVFDRLGDKHVNSTSSGVFHEVTTESPVKKPVPQPIKVVQTTTPVARKEPIVQRLVLSKPQRLLQKNTIRLAVSREAPLNVGPSNSDSVFARLGQKTKSTEVVKEPLRVWKKPMTMEADKALIEQVRPTKLLLDQRPYPTKILPLKGNIRSRLGVMGKPTIKETKRVSFGEVTEKIIPRKELLTSYGKFARGRQTVRMNGFRSHMI